MHSGVCYQFISSISKLVINREMYSTQTSVKPLNVQMSNRVYTLSCCTNLPRSSFFYADTDIHSFYSTDEHSNKKQQFYLWLKLCFVGRIFRANLHKLFLFWPVNVLNFNMNITSHQSSHQQIPHHKNSS